MSFVAHDVRTGVDRQPLGALPRGLILYTADGYMSAQLADSGMGRYVAYGGPFFDDEETSTLHHAVPISMMPELLAQPQFRQASVDGGPLTLSAGMTDDVEVTMDSRLVWRRPGATTR